MVTTFGRLNWFSKRTTVKQMGIHAIDFIVVEIILLTAQTCCY